MKVHLYTLLLPHEEIKNTTRNSYRSKLKEKQKKTAEAVFL